MSDLENPSSNPTARPVPQASLQPTDSGTGLQPQSNINIREHKAKTARALAFAFIAILAASFLLNYATEIILIYTGHATELERVERLFNVWLPVISGLTGAAATYYFTRDRG